MICISEDYLKEHCKYAYAEIDNEDILSLTRPLLILRKEYSKQFSNSKKNDQVHLDASIGIDFCNDNIKKVLGIP